VKENTMQNIPKGWILESNGLYLFKTFSFFNF